jgi:hypothetical protein
MRWTFKFLEFTSITLNVIAKYIIGLLYKYFNPTITLGVKNTKSLVISSIKMEKILNIILTKFLYMTQLIRNR